LIWLSLVMDERNTDHDTWETSGHMANLLKAAQSRNYKDLHSNVEIGRILPSCATWPNISYRVGRRLEWVTSIAGSSTTCARTS
jgi:hypothetical protein